MCEKALEIFDLEEAEVISRGGGDISSGVGVDTRNGKFFVKYNFDEKSEAMFRAEFQGLVRIGCEFNVIRNKFDQYFMVEN